MRKIALSYLFVSISTLAFVGCGSAKFNENQLQSSDEFAKSIDAEEQLGLGASDSALIVRAYREVLGRNPDAPGHRYWVSALSSKRLSIAQIRESLASSPEGQIVQAYKEILGRLPDAAGKGYWLSQLTSKKLSIEQIRKSLAESAEAKAKAVAAKPEPKPESKPPVAESPQAALERQAAETRQRITFVDLTYKICLGRAPEGDGLIHWSLQIATKKATFDQVQASICSSPEAQIVKAYREILGREPDLAGKSYWLSALTSGRLSIEQIRQSLSASDERKAIDLAAKISALRAQVAQLERERSALLAGLKSG